MSDDDSLARRVDAAQSILDGEPAAQARRIERAMAATCRAFAEAMARLDPASGAHARALAGGVVVFAGKGSPLTQGLAMGLDGEVSAAELDAVEAMVAPDGTGARQLELCPYAHPSLPALLAARGYRVHEWQLVWMRAVPSEPQPSPPPELTLRPIRPGEEDLFQRTMLSGFLESDDVPDEALALMRPMAFAAQHELWLAFLGAEPIGAATLSWADGVMFGGSAVRPAFRRRGAQGALIRARLERARQLGCVLACSNTLPGTASRRNMERHGYHVAYPKLVMLRD